MNLSVSTCVHEQARWSGELVYTLEETFAACSRARFTTVELGLAPYCRNERFMTQNNWKEYVKSIGIAAEDHGIKIGQLHAHFYSPKEWLEEDRNYHEKMLYRSAEAAAMLGVSCFVMHPDSVSDRMWYSREKSIETNIRHIRHVRSILNGEIPIAVENMTNHKFPVRYGCGPEDLLTLVRAMPDDGVGICWDFGHAVLAGVDQSASLDAVAPYLCATHVNDNNGIEDRHYLPYLYLGKIRWKEIMCKLKQMGYCHDFNFEVRFPCRGLPDALQQDMLSYMYKTGIYMLSLAE